jgi:serine/threonine protein kinase
MTDDRNTLPLGSIVDCYVITEVMGSGGFSLIYLAEDRDDGEEVIIKEFLPKKLATRDETRHVTAMSERQTAAFHKGRKLFYQEARILARLKHPNIVAVRNICLANGTAYLIMDYQRGRNLGSYIRKRGGGLSTAFLRTVFPPLLDALGEMHANGLLHLDFKPGNIHLRPGGNPLLLDFGAVHQVATSRRNRPGQIITPGYSPLEQYHATGYVGPWSDVYAVGATMRACIEGRPPPTAIQRDARDSMKPLVSLYRRRYPPPLLEAIDWAMEMDPELRPQSVAALRDRLLNPGAGGTRTADNAAARPGNAPPEKPDAISG